MKLLNDFLTKNRERQLNIHCVGDAMIDEYLDVDVKRISPECPAMVLHSNNNKCIIKPGGVANVAYQFKYFNVIPHLICWGNQSEVSLFLQHGIELKLWDSKNISNHCNLPIKKRFINNGIQIIRHDIEDYLCGLHEHDVELATTEIQEIIKNTFKPDIAILSDYNKGFFSSKNNRIIDCYKNVKTIVDPKIGPLSKWKGCTIFKPNAKEAMELSGKTHWKDQATYLQNELECESVIITFGGDRVAGIWYKDFFEFIPNRSVVVESVVGAGDAFVCFLAMAIGHGFSIPNSVEIAWNAGANYVQHKRNRPIVPAELSLSGIVNPKDLKNRDFKLVFANGCFDFGLTSSHIKCLEFAKQQGDKLVVALNSDKSISRLKGVNRPVMPLIERQKIISSLKCVDFVVSFEEDTPLELIKELNPSIIVKGGDYKKEEVVGYGIADVKIFPFQDGMSTTDKLNKIIKQQDI